VGLKFEQRGQIARLGAAESDRVGVSVAGLHRVIVARPGLGLLPIRTSVSPPYLRTALGRLDTRADIPRALVEDERGRAGSRRRSPCSAPRPRCPTGAILLAESERRAPAAAPGNNAR